jgi:hypothetical protein
MNTKELAYVGFIAPKGWKDKLQTIAETKQVPLSAIVRWAVEAYLENKQN